MPYIPHEERRKFNFTLPAGLSPGQMTFIIADLIDQYVGMVPDYDRLHSAIGVLECCKQEVYRRLVVPYENGKLAVNGDTFQERV